MNSSGIKRGLATTAVSALAVAGIPFIATSASAATGDVLTVLSVSPVRNGGDQGLLIRAAVKDITATNVRIADASFNDLDPDTLTQNIGTIAPEGTLIASGSAGDSTPGDGLAEQLFRVSSVVTSTDGGAYTFGIYEEEDAAPNDTTVDDTEARATVSGNTSGAPTRAVASPVLQSAPVGQLSDDYVVTLQDAAGRTTQLSGDEQVRFSEVSGPGAVTFSPTGPLTDDLVGPDGKFEFAASSTAQGLHVLRAGVYADANTDPAVTPESFGTNVNLDVSGQPAADESIDPTEFNLITGADDRDGYDQTSTSASVRQDQNVVTVEIKDLSQANRIVTLTATSATAPNAVTFGGEATQTRTATLNAQGVGTFTFTVDAGSIQTGDIFRIDGPALDNTNAADVFPSNGFTVNYTGAALAAGEVDADQTVYFSSFGGTVNPVVTVVDQYGDPVTNAFVTYEITSGPNDTNTESARVQTDENGQVTFSITDTKATATNQADGALTFRVYPDAFEPTEVLTDTGSRIDYSADGTGADFLVSVDGQVPGGAVYNPSINPLTDAVADNDVLPTATDGDPAGDSADEDATVAIAGGTTGAPVTVTVDNGGLILDGGSTLADGVTSVTRTAAQTFEIVGTTAGTVNITVTSGGKTQTATLEVETLEDNSATARNVELEGPERAVAGDVVDFTAIVSDAFGNPVTGFDGDDFDVRITGPGNEQGNSGDSDENGEIDFSIEITQGAANPVTLRLEGDGAQFGAEEDRRTAASTTDDAPGLTASEDVASATVNVVDIDALKAAVEAAERDLAESQANLAVAQARLDVAQTELAIAQAEVDRLQERKQNLRQKLNKAKRNDNKQKAKTTRKKLRNVKRQLNDAKNAVVVAQTAVDGEQAVVDLRKTEVEKAEAALAEAQADLDEAQN